MSATSGTAPAIEASGLSKQFGAVLALNGVDVRVDRGESLALFGPNGAGKTTLIRVLTLGLRLASGQFRIYGFDHRTDPQEIRRRIGLISHQSMLYDQLTLAENLEFFAKLYGVEHPRRRCAELLDTIGLGHRSGDLVGTLSHGMQQRLSIVRALVHDPPVIFLDEPFTGLDPQAASMLRSTVQELRARGHSVLLVTHNLRQGLDLSDRWLLLFRGRVVEQGASAGTDPRTLEHSYIRTRGGAT